MFLKAFLFDEVISSILYFPSRSDFTDVFEWTATNELYFSLQVVYDFQWVMQRSASNARCLALHILWRFVNDNMLFDFVIRVVFVMWYVTVYML